jgi:hypothetical protein
LATSLEGFSCTKKVKPMKEWVQEEDPDPEICHPCLIPPAAASYMGTLEEAGAAPQIKKLEEAWNSGDSLTVAETLDTIKEEVGEDLKKELMALDCFTQSFKPEAAADQQKQ